MNYEILKIDFNGNTKTGRERSVNEFLEKGYTVSSLTDFSGKGSYGVVLALQNGESSRSKQMFTTVNFNNNSVPSKQLSPIEKDMKNGWKVVCLTGFSSVDGKEYGVAAVLEQLEQCEQENSDS